MQQIPLEDAQLMIDGDVYVLPRALLIVTTDTQGWKTWTVKVMDAAADWPPRVGREPGVFTGGIYSGECYPATSRSLVGTGPLTGL